MLMSQHLNWTPFQIWNVQQQMEVDKAEKKSEFILHGGLNEVHEKHIFGW